MKKQFKNTLTLLFFFSLLLAGFMLLRFAFYFYNFSFFGKISLTEFFQIIFCGIKMDVSALVYFNLAFIILFSIPLPIRYHKWYRIVLFIFFISFNALTMGINAADIFYYPFNSKRITAESISLMHEFIRLIPRFMAYYWYGFLLFFALLVLLAFLYFKIDRKNNRPEKFNYYLQSLFFILICGFALLGARGSLGTKPLLPISASRYVGFQKAPIATNSVFTLMFSFDKKTLNEVHYLPADSLKKIFPFTKKYNRPANKMNVMVIVLESFSAEFVGALNNGKGYTPFFDSLSRQGLLFTNMYANSERSIKGIPAIIAGAPSLMEEELQASPYQTNCMPGLGYYMKKMDYHTAFFHGSINGSLGFDVFSKTVGFDHYFGMNEFNNKAFYDGAWGITDEEFFLFTAGKLSTMPQPFCAVLFSISSHHPYFIPEKHKNRFPKGDEEIYESIGYSDYSLKQFFLKAEKQKWYSNTLFVITADHSYPTRHPADSFYRGIAGQHRIPLLFFSPGRFVGLNSSIIQQHDIMPSILDYTGYNDSCKLYGNSVFSDSTSRYAYFWFNNSYFIYNQTHLLVFNQNEGAIGLYEYRRDINLVNNLIQQQPQIKNELESHIKAVIQTYNDAVIHNRLCPEQK